MAQTLPERSPLMNSISTKGMEPEERPENRHFYWPGFYYRVLDRKRIVGWDENEQVSFTLSVGSYVLCFNAEDRHYTIQPSPDEPTGWFVTFLALHPETGREIRFHGWAGSALTRGLERIDNAMETLAIAAETGLSL